MSLGEVLGKLLVKLAQMFALIRLKLGLTLLLSLMVPRSNVGRISRQRMMSDLPGRALDGRLGLRDPTLPFISTSSP